ncbi:MAG: glycosyltransferase family 8 protein, partial [Clostridiaceae bacterium]|nr:glycosyltransferase family 8 protein [Clostridiaceae bacterium]
DKYYDIIILQKEISETNKKLLYNMVSDFENVYMRFYNPKDMIDGVNFYIAHEVYAEEAYYRLLTPWILNDYSKAIVMDCDIILKDDIAKLYDINIEDYIAAGVKDIVFQGILNGIVPGTYEYCKNEMKMEQPYNYINTGVLLLNLNKIRESYSQEEIIKFAAEHKFRIQEQDVLNVLFENNIKFIDLKWNYYVSVNDFIKTSINFAPLTAEDEYKKCLNPVCIHYAGAEKPWNNAEIEFAEEFWSVAKRTPVYEILISRMIDKKLSIIATKNFTTPSGIIDNRSGARKLADKVLPKGTMRREFTKKLLPKGSLRWKILKKVYLFLRPKYNT